MKLNILNRFFIIVFILIGANFFGFQDVEAQVRAPENLDVVESYPCAIEVTWQQEGNLEEDITDFYRLLKTDGIGDWKPINLDDIKEDCNDVGVCTYEYTFQDVFPGVSYELGIETVWDNGGSGSEKVEVSTPKVSDPEDVPTDIDLKDWVDLGGGSYNIHIGWEPKGGSDKLLLNGFRVFISENNGEFSKDQTFNLKSFSDNDYVWINDPSPEDFNEYKIKTYSVGEYCFEDNLITNDMSEEDSGDYENYPRYKFSENASDILKIPEKPVFPENNIVKEDGKWKIKWEEPSFEPSNYEFEISRDSDFDPVIEEYSKKYDGDKIETDLMSLPIGNDYYYRVKAVWERGEMSSESVYSDDGDFSTALSKPENFEARVLYVNEEKAVVSLNWDDGPKNPRHTKIYIDDNEDEDEILEMDSHKGVDVYPATSTTVIINENLIENGKEYKFEVSFAYIDDEDDDEDNIIDEKVSDPVSINLNVKNILEGAAWTAGSDLDGEAHGIGWISFNSDNAGQGGAEHSVYINNQNELSGYAWAGARYGWLSFNEEDISGCPDSGVKINDEGDLSGSARFVSAEGNPESAWFGCVSFSGQDPSYGVKLEDDGYFYGAAWGDDVGGWIVFGPTEDGTGNTACVDGSFAGDDNMEENIIVKTNEAIDRMSCAEDEEEKEDKDPIILNLKALDHDEIEIEWENSISYDNLNIYYKKDSASSYDGPIYYDDKDDETDETIEGIHSYIKGSLDSDTLYTFYVEGIDKDGSYESAVESVRTKIKFDPAEDDGYSFWCNAVGQDKIDVYWNGPEDGYSLTLHKKLEGSSFQFLDRMSGGSGNYSDLDLESGRTWIYKLDVSGPENDSLTSICTTWNEDTEAPSDLNVWGIDKNNLHINWKDNATEPHKFKLQRMKVTPEDPSFNHSTGEKIETYDLVGDLAGGGSYPDRLKVYWENNTNVEDNYGGKIKKAPFYHVIERTTTTYPSVPFNDLDENNIFEPTAGGDYYDPSFASFAKHFDEDKNYSSDKTDYYFVDGGLEEATTYYYRIKACSYIRVDTDKDDDLEEVCSNDYSFVKYNTTAPAKPTDFDVKSDTKNSITLEWVDNSSGEDGYKIYRKNGDSYSLLRTLPANTTEFTDSRLSSDTSYYYKIRAYKNNPGRGGETVYSSYDSVSGKTDFVVNVSFVGDQDAGGRVMDNKGRMNCSDNCSVSYDNEVSLNATADENSIFVGWSGDCEGDSCVLSSNSNVNARFEEAEYELTVKILGGDGLMVTSTPSGIECVANNGTCFSNFDNEREVTLTATSSAVWIGCDSDTQKSCSVNMSEDKDITVDFDGVISLLNKNKTYKTVLQNTKNFLSDVVSFNVLDVEKSNLRKSNNNLASLSEGEFGKDVSERLIRGINIVKDKIISLIKKVDAADIIQGVDEEDEKYIINSYFEQFEENLDFDSNPGYFKDESVEDNIVYVYRVKVVYNTGEETAYSPMAGSKTLPDGSFESDEEIGICTRNSFCEKMKKFKIRGNEDYPIIHEPENQCNSNAECRNVGTMRRFIEEQ